MEDKHDIHDFIKSTHREIKEEYDRIYKRASEDPGTAGDQGEENWAKVLRDWLPDYFHVVTKGRILFENGYASPQVDVIVLRPSYPKVLFNKKLYLAGGVVAAFECKTTLNAKHVEDAVKTGRIIRNNLPSKVGTPYKELTKSIVYGILAHSHVWKGENSTPIENVNRILQVTDKALVSHPSQILDFITVADLGVWQAMKHTYHDPEASGFGDLSSLYSENGAASSAYMIASIKGDQSEYFTPIGSFLSGLYSKLAWSYAEMRSLDQYFRSVDMLGEAEVLLRYWPMSIYSIGVEEKLKNGKHTKENYDEWKDTF